MTTATSLLREEHEAIGRMLDATQEIAGLLERGVKVPPETLTGLLEFFREFADRCHHAKEEELLFPLLERKGLPRAGGPLGVMEEEHERGRQLLKLMANAAELYGEGSTSAGTLWAATARTYVELLRAHIYKENSVLFQIADRMLTEAEQKGLVSKFDEIEINRLGAATHERLHALMEKLTARALVG